MCSHPHSDAGFGVLGWQLPPTGKIRDGEATSSKRSTALCFSSRSRPSLPHWAWECVIRRPRSDSASRVPCPSCWLMHGGTRPIPYPSTLAMHPSAALPVARRNGAASAGQHRREAARGDPLQRDTLTLRGCRAGRGDQGVGGWGATAARKPRGLAS